MRLRSHLSLVVLGTLLPVLIFTGVLIVLFHQQTRRATEDDLADTARALSMTVDRELGASIEALQVLAASDALRSGNLQAFDRVARTVLATQTTRWENIVLYDHRGQQLMNLRVPFGTALPTTNDPELIAQVVKSRTPAVSNLFRGRRSGKRLVRVTVPVLVDGTPRYVLGASLAPASLSGLLAAALLPAGSVAGLIDRNDVIVARSRAAEQFVGQRATPDLIAKARQMREGSFRARTKEGGTVYAAISRSSLSGWLVAIGVPEPVIDGPLRTSLGFLTGAAVLAILVGTALAAVLGRRLERPMLALARAAPRLAKGETIALPRSPVDEMNAVAAAVESASRELHRGQQAAAALARVSQAFTETPDVSAIGRQIVEHVVPVFDAASANLRVLDPDGSLRTVARHSASAIPELAADVMPRGMGITGAAVNAGAPLQSLNILEDPLIQLTDGVRRLLRESGVVVWLAVPLRVNGKPIGALSIGARAGRAFSPAEVTLLQTFADQAALAVRQAQLFEESEHRRQTAEALAEIGRLLSQTLDPRVVGTRIVDSVQTLLAARSAILYSLEPSSRVLTAHTVSTDLGPVFDWTRRLEPGEGIAWLAVDQRGPILSPDVLADARLVYPLAIAARVAPSAHRALLAVPLTLHDRIVGALVVADATGRVYDAHDAQLAQAFATQAAIALENASLYQDLQRAYAELARAQAQLTQAQKMEAIGHLAGGIAHDFNNLLTVILGRCALLLDQLLTDDPARPKLESIQKAADRAALLTRQLLAFSRRQVLQSTALDLTHVVTELLPMLHSVLGETSELAVLGEGAPAFVKADQGQLDQVLINLVVNARDAMPQGGRVTIRTATVDVDAEAAARLDLPAGPYVRLAVTDTGHGMSPEVRARVFEPFFTTKGVGKGTGLGLSMAHGIIGQHGGTMVVESREGEGSTFTVYLPRIDASDAPAPPPPEIPGRGDPATARILLVDDEDDLRSVARDILGAAGYTVLEARDGPGALRIARETPGPIDLLVTDVVMPQLSGRELAQHLAPMHPETKVLYMSGHTGDAILRHGVSESSAAFLPKPFGPEALLQTVCEVLGGRP
jgi:signal transduction histidine kinase/HAMP domain-containing protein